MKKILSITICMALAATSFPQAGAKVQTPGTQAPTEQTAQDAAKAAAAARARQIQALKNQQDLDAEFRKFTEQGLEVQIQSIAHFRGARDFQLSGVGLVVGLEGTGDTNKSIITQTMYANYLKSQGLTVDSTTVAAKNVAIVMLTARIPAFSKPGTRIDVTASSLGDAKSLQGGTLVTTALYGPSDTEKVIASAQGPLSIGGFNAGASGSSAQRNHVNVGRIPGGGEIQERIESKVVFDDPTGRKLYLDLDDPNPTTLTRIIRKLSERYHELTPKAVDSTTVAITVPENQDPSEVMAKVGQTTVFADTPAKIVINERTGTIVVGGNVEIGPAMIVSGSLNVRIETINDVSQPGPFSGGTTTPVANSSVSVGQDKAKVAILKPLTTVAQLARIFQTLDLKPNDVIQILQLLQQQGALKARIELQ